jgi:hypothetical protein
MSGWAGWKIAPRAGDGAGAAPLRYIWDPPEPLFSDDMLKAKGTYGRARPNPAFKSRSFSPTQWLLAHALPVLAALLVVGLLLVMLELLISPAYVLPKRPTAAILAWVEKVYTVVAGTVSGLLLCEIALKMVKYVRALIEDLKELT